MRTARAHCLALLDWFRQEFTVLVDGQDKSGDLFSIYFVQLAHNLLQYQYIAEANKVGLEEDGSGGEFRWWDWVRLREQVEAVITLDGRTRDQWETLYGFGSTKWQGDELKIPTSVNIPDGCEDPPPGHHSYDWQWQRDTLLLAEPERYTVVRSRGGGPAREVDSCRGQSEFDQAYCQTGQLLRSTSASNIKDFLVTLASSTEESKK